MNNTLAKLLAAAIATASSAPSLAAASPMGSATQPSPSVQAPTSPDRAVAAHVDELSVRNSVTLGEVFDLLKRRSPRYKAYAAQIDVAKAEIKAARVLPNPVLNLAILYLNTGFNQNGVGTYYANATLPVLIAGQRQVRVKTAKVGVRSAQADLRLNYHELAHEARELFVELQADQARVAVLDEALADLAYLQELVVARRRSGVETDYDILRIDVEAAAWKARRAEEEASAQDTAGELGVLLGLPGWFPEANGELTRLGVHADADRSWPEIERRQPGIVAASQAEAYAVKTIDLAKRERWPVPSITVGTVAIQNYYSISTQVGISLPIPFFDWGQGMIARAKANSNRARREKEAVIASTRAELQRAMRLMSHHRHALATFEKDVVAKIPELATMSEKSFRAGEARLIDLLDATRVRFELRLTRIDMLEATVQAEVDVLAVTGRIEELEPR